MQKRDVGHAKFFGKLTIIQSMSLIGGSALLLTFVLRYYFFA
jgi:hypothetical protein